VVSCAALAVLLLLLCGARMQRTTLTKHT
jgi:hypothetical protein